MNPWLNVKHPETREHPNTPLQGMGFFLAQMSSLDQRLKLDRVTVEGWMSAVGQFGPELVAKAFAAYYNNPDLARFQVAAAWARAWCVSASPKRERCPDHPSYYAGSTCGGCRADRLELGLEKPIAPSTLPKPRELGSAAPEVRAITAGIGKTLQEPT